MRKLKKSASFIPRPVSYFILAVFLVITIYPFLFMILTSLKSVKEFMNNLWSIPAVFQWGNYAKAWTQGHLRTYTINSLVVTVAAVGLIAIVTTLAGYAFARLNFRGAGLIFAILLATLMVPGEVTLVPLFIIIRRMGLLNTLTNLVLIYTAWGLAVNTYLMRNFFISLPEELGDAARVDGCSELGVFSRIYLPLAMPALATVIIFAMVQIWGEFLWVLITNTRTAQTIPLGLLRFQGQYQVDWGVLTAGLSITSVPLIIVYLIFAKQFIRGLGEGAIKG